MKNTILIHTARTWERMRLLRPHQEMPYDNIESVEVIEQIADEIFRDELIQEFLRTNYKTDFFIRKTNLMGDMYIEDLAATKINKLLA